MLQNVHFALSVPADNDRGPQYMEQILAAIHQANVRRLPITFAFGSYAKAVRLFCHAPTELAATVTAQLSAHYPDADIDFLADDAMTVPSGQCVWSAELRLRPDIFPIRRYAQFEDVLNRNISDPLTGIFAALTLPLHAAISSRIEIMVRPIGRWRVIQARRILRTLTAPLFRAHPGLARACALAATSRHRSVRLLSLFPTVVLRSQQTASSGSSLASASGRTHDREDDVQAAADKLGRHLFEAHVRLLAFAPSAHADHARASLRRLAGAFGQFTVPRMATFRMSSICRCNNIRHRSRGRGFLLSCEELATLFHPATSTVRAPAMQITACRELEPPVLLPTNTREPDVAVLGRTKFRSRREIFGMRGEDRRRHMAVIGKTGMGKTTLLHKLIVSDIQYGRGLALIDPHGDLADAILDCIPAFRTNDVVLFDAGDRHFPLAFNPLACQDPDQRPLVASGVIAAFKKLFGNSWGPRLEHILRNALLALLEIPNTSLLSLQRLLSDAAYRKTVANRLADPIVKSFWQHEYAGWKPQFRAEAVAPISNKVGQFLSQPILRAIVGQSRSSLDLRRVMDEGRILIVNLSKGRIGEDASNLLGSLLVSGIQLAAMSRADIPESKRRDFHLYVDEFQNFATESFATILSEARKYRLSLVIANQYLAQMDEPTASAVFGNVGSIISFCVGASDAETLANQLGGAVTPQDLMALPRFSAYVRLSIDGMLSRPFSMQTMPAPRIPNLRNRSDVIRRVSRHRYTRPATQVEAEIRQAFAFSA